MTDPGARWLERFGDPAPIRKLGAIEYVACRAADGARRLVVARAADAEPGPAGELLAEIARVHRLVDHPRVPKVVEVDAEAPPSYVALASDAVVDFENLAETVSGAHLSIDHGGASAFVIAFLELLHAAHAVVDPASGKPVCMGAFSAGNVLASEDGAVSYLGWGHPWRGPARGALLPLAPQAFLAPEAAFGVAPTPGSDLAAVVRFFHSFERLGELPTRITACLAGDASSPALAERILALLGNTQHPRPADRSIPRFLDDFRPTLELLGLDPADARFAADVRAVVAAWRARASAAPLVVARDGRWCRPPLGEVVTLARRGAMRRMLLALAEARRDTPGEPLSWEHLLHAGWPDENPRIEAARNRVYVTVAQLRALGLRDVLTRTDAGYLLDPSVPLAWSDVPSG